MKPLHWASRSIHKFLSSSFLHELNSLYPLPNRQLLIWSITNNLRSYKSGASYYVSMTEGSDDTTISSITESNGQTGTPLWEIQFPSLNKDTVSLFN